MFEFESWRYLSLRRRDENGLLSAQLFECLPRLSKDPMARRPRMQTFMSASEMRHSAATVVRRLERRCHARAAMPLKACVLRYASRLV